MASEVMLVPVKIRIEETLLGEMVWRSPCEKTSNIEPFFEMDEPKVERMICILYFQSHEFFRGLTDNPLSIGIFIH